MIAIDLLAFPRRQKELNCAHEPRRELVAARAATAAEKKAAAAEKKDAAADPAAALTVFRHIGDSSHALTHVWPDIGGHESPMSCGPGTTQSRDCGRRGRPARPRTRRQPTAAATF